MRDIGSIPSSPKVQKGKANFLASTIGSRKHSIDLGSAQDGDEVNDMLLDAIKAKLAILDSIDG